MRVLYMISYRVHTIIIQLKIIFASNLNKQHRNEKPKCKEKCDTWPGVVTYTYYFVCVQNAVVVVSLFVEVCLCPSNTSNNK